MASKAQEAANRRAQALGFKNAYDRRIKTALAKGKSRSEARGNHPKETKVRKKQPLPTTYHLVGDQYLGNGKIRHRDVQIPLTPDQAKEVRRLEKAGKPRTAKTYVIAEVWGAAILAGVEQYQEGWDYDLEKPFPGYDYDDFDLSDIPDYDDLMDQPDSDSETDPYIH